MVSCGILDPTPNLLVWYPEAGKIVPAPCVVHYLKGRRKITSIALDRAFTWHCGDFISAAREALLNNDGIHSGSLLA